jgi:hypothetical protein
MLARTKSDKKPVIAALVPKRSDHLRLEEVELVPGPGRGFREPGVAGESRSAVQRKAGPGTAARGLWRSRTDRAHTGLAIRRSSDANKTVFGSQFRARARALLFVRTPAS